MRRVRDVSMVDLWAADAYFVMETPHTLKPAIDKMIPKDIIKIAELSAFCWKANVVSSIFPLSPQTPLCVQSIF